MGGMSWDMLSLRFNITRLLDEFYSCLSTFPTKDLENKRQMSQALDWIYNDYSTFFFLSQPRLTNWLLLKAKANSGQVSHHG